MSSDEKLEILRAKIDNDPDIIDNAAEVINNRIFMIVHNLYRRLISDSEMSDLEYDFLEKLIFDKCTER